jgi:hypothetical protein
MSPSVNGSTGARLSTIAKRHVFGSTEQPPLVAAEPDVQLLP